MMNDDSFLEWCNRLVKKHPMITDIILTGSRGTDVYNNDSDWDVIICLEEELYEQGTGPWLEAYLTIWTHFEGLDLFFVRPDGEFTRHLGGMTEYLSDQGDWDRFYKAIGRSEYKVMFSKEGTEQ